MPLRSSRNSTTETANAIAKEAQARRGPPASGGGGSSSFIRSGAQQQRLAQAAAATKNKALQVPDGLCIALRWLSGALVSPGACAHQPAYAPRPARDLGDIRIA